MTRGGNLSQEGPGSKPNAGLEEGGCSGFERAQKCPERILLD